MPARKPAFRPQVELLEARDVPSFGTGGFVTTNLLNTTSDTVCSLAVQSDGKIVAAGFDGLVRYNSDGSLDTSFNAGGAQPGVIPSPGGDSLFDVAIQADGKIVVGGSRVVKTYNKSAPDRAYLLMRFNPNGTPDTTFGTNGVVVQTFGKSTASDVLRSLALQADGKIVAAGLINSNGWGNTSADIGNWGVARFNANGTLDTSFDKDGFLATDLGTGYTPTARSVAVQADGKIVVGGDVFVDNVRRRDVAVVRYLANGALDTSFGGTGKVLVDFAPEYAAGATSGNDYLGDLAVRGDGRIVFAGYGEVRDTSTGLFASPGQIGRLNANGSLDVTFGGDGRVAVLPPNYNGSTIGRNVIFVGLVVQPDGGIVAWSPSSSQYNHPSAAVRVNADGTLDTAFGDGGYALLTWPTGLQSNSAFGAIALQPDGKIIVAGSSTTDSPGYSFALARLNPDGTLDA